MKRSDFISGGLACGLGSAAWSKGPEDPVVFDTANTRDFVVALEAIARQGKVGIVAEAYPLTWKEPLLDKFVGRTLPAREALKQLCDAYNYEIVQRSPIFVLQKLYSKPGDQVAGERTTYDDVVPVGMEEMLAIARDVKTATTNVSQRRFRNLTHIKWTNPAINEICRELGPEGIKKEIPVSQLSPSVYAYAKYTIWRKYFERTWSATQHPLYHLDDRTPIRLDIGRPQSEIDRNSTKAPTLGARRTMVIRAAVPINPENPDSETTVFPEKFYSLDQNIGGFAAGATKAPMEPPGTVVTLADVAKGFSTPEAPLAVLPMLARKPVCVAGLEGRSAESVINALATVYNLRVAQKDEETEEKVRVKTLVRPTLGTVRVDTFWKVLANVLPPIYNRIIFAPKPARDPSVELIKTDMNILADKLAISAYANLHWRVGKNLRERNKDKNLLKNMDFEDECRYATLVIQPTLQQLHRAKFENPIDLLHFDRGWIVVMERPNMSLTFRFVDPETRQAMTETFYTVPFSL